jgi:archaeosine-15-forming tRNA-guanine transglycosylase
MKPKFRVILEQAIEEGVRRGYSRAHKHVENPTEDAIIEHIEDAVMSAIHEYFTFDESEYQ